MSYYLAGTEGDTATVRLPNGSDLTVMVKYTLRETNGVTVLIVASCLSLAAVFGLLTAISISAFNTRKSRDSHLFVRTHVAGYFVSMLVCDMLQAIGSIINAAWVRHQMVELGTLCMAQGAVKQTSDVGTAIWTLIIAIHTFCILFLEWKIRTYALWATLVFGWSTIFALVMIGPATLNTEQRGSFFGVSGYWCWISEEYEAERVTLDYMIMWSSAFFSFILYTLVFLRLRGNIVVSGWRVRFRRRQSSGLATFRSQSSDKLLGIARQMLLYPIAYTVLILPIAAARFTSWSGREVPFEATIFCDTIFLLMGAVNVVLFTTTRRVLPPQTVLPNLALFRSRSTVSTKSTSSVGSSMGSVDLAVDPFYASPPMSVQAFSEEKSSDLQPQRATYMPGPIVDPRTRELIPVRTLPPVPYRPPRRDGDNLPDLEKAGYR